MNVAITRARMKLIILGDASTLTKHPFIRSYTNISWRCKNKRRRAELHDTLFRLSFVLLSLNIFIKARSSFLYLISRYRNK